MKAAVVFGDMSADRTDDNYPQAAFCDDCYSKAIAQGEDSGIVNEVSYDPELHGEECCVCGDNDC